MIPRLHVLTSEEGGSRWSHGELAHAASEGGADVVQYREKRALPIEREIETLHEVRRALRPGTFLVVNDRWELARISGARGLHLGRDDLEPGQARRLLGHDIWIGYTVNREGDLGATEELPVDYLGVGPVFGTTSKAGAADRLGLAMLSRICRRARFPVIAIGGITAERVESVIRAGAAGVAVLSAVSSAEDAARETARLRREIDRAL